MPPPTFLPGSGPQPPAAAAPAPPAQAAPPVATTPAVVAASASVSGGGGSQANSATLVMGPTGSGKSCLADTVARYLERQYNKCLLLYSCDGGGYPMEVQKGIAVGRIRLWRMYTRDPGNLLALAWDTMLKASLGWWPMEINPATGESPIGVRMMPPLATLFTMMCPNGHVVKQTTKSQELVTSMCPVCRQLVTDQTMRVERLTRQPKFFADVGGVFFDGLSSMCAWGEADLGDRAGRQELSGLEGAIGGKVVSGDFKLGQVTMSHIGFSQQQARALVLNTQGIPNLKVPPIFTALTLDASVEGTRVCGPELSGKKKTPVAPQWFGNVLEAEKRELGAGRYQHRLWLTQWKDPEGVTHLCKNRASPGVLPEFLEDPPMTGTAADAQTAFSQFSLARFFEMLDAGLQRGIGQELQGKAAVESRVVQYEDPFQDAQAPMMATAPSAAMPSGGPMGPGGLAAPSSALPNAVLAPPAPQQAPGVVAPATAPGPLPTVPLMQPAPPPQVAGALTTGPTTVAPPPGRRPMAPPAPAPVPGARTT